MRCQIRSIGILITLVCLAVPVLAQHDADWPEVQKIVRACTGVYDELPKKVVVPDYTGAPILGNGAIGVVVAGTESSQTLYMHPLANAGKALGGVTIKVKERGGSENSFRYEQNIEKAQVDAVVTINGNPTELSAWVAGGCVCRSEWLLRRGPA